MIIIRKSAPYRRFKLSQETEVNASVIWWRCHRRIITDYLLAAGAQSLPPDGQRPCGAGKHDKGRREAGTSTAVTDLPASAASMSARMIPDCFPVVYPAELTRG